MGLIDRDAVRMREIADPRPLVWTTEPEGVLGMRKRKHVAYLSILLLAVGVVMSDGCLMVQDSISGPSPLAKQIETCNQDCAKNANAARSQEMMTHEETIAQCHGDAACLRQEAERYRVALQLIAEAEKGCMIDCHNQGGGSAGQ